MHQQLDSVQAQIVSLFVTMKSVTDFEIKPDIKGAVKNMADHVKTGKIPDAVAAGSEALRMGRNLLGSFLNSMVTDKQKGQEVQIGYFTRQVTYRREDRFYDDDLVVKLETLRMKMVEAVREETNGTFDKRIAAYNTMARAIKDIDAQQERRDTAKLAELDAARKRCPGVRDEDLPGLNKSILSNRRIQVIDEKRQQGQKAAAERQQRAQAILALLD